MAKAYWIATYRSITNPDALAAYAKDAGPALQASGGRFIARGMPAKTFELGVMQRVVLIEFDSVEQATAPTTARPIRPRTRNSKAPSSATSALSRAWPRSRAPAATPAQPQAR